MSSARLNALIAANGGVVTTQQLLEVMSAKALEVAVRRGRLVRIRRGVYTAGLPDVARQLAALDATSGARIVACMNTAAQVYGFDIEPDERLHVLDPGTRIRPSANVMVHQRIGAPLKVVSGRLFTAPAWTAIEIARALRRPRALAVLDAALHAGACTVADLEAATIEQKGRRGIVTVRGLLAVVDGRAESPMESEARLVFIDGGLAPLVLQHEIVDRCGDLWRVDFAWPEARVAAEYDSMEWHANPTAWKRDHIKSSRLHECGWDLVRFVVDDVRRYPADLVDRIGGRIESARLAS
jgi:hypothetical protein